MPQFVEIVTDVMDNFRNRIENSEDLNFRGASKLS